MKYLALFISSFLLGMLLAYGCTSINKYNRTIKMQKEGIVTMLDVDIPQHVTGRY